MYSCVIQALPPKGESSKYLSHFCLDFEGTDFLFLVMYCLLWGVFFFLHIYCMVTKLKKMPLFHLPN